MNYELSNTKRWKLELHQQTLHFTGLIQYLHQVILNEYSMKGYEKKLVCSFLGFTPILYQTTKLSVSL
jgi:hypothetical protein